MAQWIVSPNGTPSGDGSLANPWDITTALNLKSTVILPGDTLYLRGAIYRSPDAYKWWPQLLGAPGNPIYIRPYPGEHAALDLLSFNDSFILDNPLRPSNTTGHNCHDVEFWDIEFFSSTITRSTSQTGNNGLPNQLMVAGVNIRLVHCYIHDIGNFISSAIAKDAEVYGNIVLDIGWNAPDRGHGHAFYIENDGSSGSVKNYENNFAGCTFDDLVQEFGTVALTENILFKKNLLWDGGAFVGRALIQFMLGQNRPHGCVINENMFFTSTKYGAGYVQIGWQWDGQNHDVDVEDNYVLGPDFEVGNWDSAIVKRNHVFSRDTDAAVLLNTYTPAVPPQSVASWQVDDNEYGPGILKVGSRHVDGSGTAISDGATGYTDPAQWKAAIGGDANSTFNATPKLAILIHPSTKLPGRIHIGVWNPDALAAIPIDLTGLITGPFAVYDAQNFISATAPSPTPIASGDGSNPIVNIPTVTPPRKPAVNASTPPHTAPYFLTLVVLSGSALDGTWTPIPGEPIPPPAPPLPPAPPIPVPGGHMNIGDTIRISSTGSTVGVRADHDIALVKMGSEPDGTIGVLLAGPTPSNTADPSTGKIFQMWDVKWPDMTGWSVGDLFVVTTPAPTPPPSTHSATLSWSARPDADAGYTVYRNGTKIATVTTPGYVDHSVSSGTTYTYTVTVASSATGSESVMSNQVSAAIPSTVTPPPPPPPSTQHTPVTDLTVTVQ